MRRKYKSGDKPVSLGAHGAAFHDGERWRLIFNNHAMEKMK